MAATIIPAILVKTRKELNEQLLKAHLVCTDVQIDLVDGKFVAPASWPYTEPTSTTDIAELVATSGMTIEIDVMAENPLAVLDMWTAAGATRVLLHLDAPDAIATTISQMKERYGYEKEFIPESLSLGLAITVDTNLELIEPYVDDINFVQFMGIKRIGVQGQPFAEEVFTKIALFKKKHPNVPIQVDGGVTLAVAPKLLQLGVSRLIVGSALWNAPDFEIMYGLFQELTLQYGMFEK